MANLCRQFSVMMDRDVIDRTGISGVFDFHLESFWAQYASQTSRLTARQATQAARRARLTRATSRQRHESRYGISG
jgi:uncharacterized protein (TIGR03435 family)